MCVNTKTSTALVHVKVDSLTSDQCLFQQMTEEYRRVRHEHEFRITNFFPLWASNLLRAISVRFPAILTLPGVLSNFPSMLSYALNGMHVHKISSGDFVRVRICHTYYSAQFRNQPAILTFSIVPAGANRDRVLSQMVQDTKYTPRGWGQGKKIYLWTSSNGRCWIRRYTIIASAKARASYRQFLVDQVPQEDPRSAGSTTRAWWTKCYWMGYSCKWVSELDHDSTFNTHSTIGNFCQCHTLRDYHDG